LKDAGKGGPYGGLKLGLLTLFGQGFPDWPLGIQGWERRSAPKRVPFIRVRVR